MTSTFTFLGEKWTFKSWFMHACCRNLRKCRGLLGVSNPLIYNGLHSKLGIKAQHPMLCLTPGYFMVLIESYSFKRGFKGIQSAGKERNLHKPGALAWTDVNRQIVAAAAPEKNERKGAQQLCWKGMLTVRSTVYFHKAADLFLECCHADNGVREEDAGARGCRAQPALCCFLDDGMCWETIFLLNGAARRKCIFYLQHFS